MRPLQRNSHYKHVQLTLLRRRSDANNSNRLLESVDLRELARDLEDKGGYEFLQETALSQYDYVLSNEIFARKADTYGPASSERRRQFQRIVRKWRNKSQAAYYQYLRDDLQLQFVQSSEDRQVSFEQSPRRPSIGSASRNRQVFSPADRQLAIHYTMALQVRQIDIEDVPSHLPDWIRQKLATDPLVGYQQMFVGNLEHRTKHGSLYIYSVNDMMFRGGGFLINGIRLELKGSWQDINAGRVRLYYYDDRTLLLVQQKLEFADRDARSLDILETAEVAADLRQQAIANSRAVARTRHADEYDIVKLDFINHPPLSNIEFSPSALDGIVASSVLCIPTAEDVQLLTFTSNVPGEWRTVGQSNKICFTVAYADTVRPIQSVSGANNFADMMGRLRSMNLGGGGGGGLGSGGAGFGGGGGAAGGLGDGGGGGAAGGPAASGGGAAGGFGGGGPAGGFGSAGGFGGAGGFAGGPVGGGDGAGCTLAIRSDSQVGPVLLLMDQQASMDVDVEQPRPKRKAGRRHIKRQAKRPANEGTIEQVSSSLSRQTTKETRHGSDGSAIQGKDNRRPPPSQLTSEKEDDRKPPALSSSHLAASARNPATFYTNLLDAHWSQEQEQGSALQTSTDSLAPEYFVEVEEEGLVRQERRAYEHRGGVLFGGEADVWSTPWGKLDEIDEDTM